MIATVADTGFLSPVTRERRGRRLVLALVGGAVLSFVAMGALFALLNLAGLGHWIDPEAIQGAAEGPERLLDESRGLALLGGLLLVPALSLLLVASRVYRRAPASFLWPGRRPSPGLVLAGMVVIALILSAVAGLAVLNGEAMNPPVLDDAYSPRSRLIYAATALVFTACIGLAEEVVFRGVLLQAGAAFVRNGVLLCVLNGLIFAAVHFEADPVAFAVRAVMGAAWAWAALRLGGLEFAIGGHWANNLMVALVFQPFSATPEVEPGFALWAVVIELVIAAIVVGVVEALARRRARRRTA